MKSSIRISGKSNRKLAQKNPTGVSGESLDESRLIRCLTSDKCPKKSRWIECLVNDRSPSKVR